MDERSRARLLAAHMNGLLSMGFSQEQAIQATIKNGTDVSKCLDWLEEQDSWTTVPTPIDMLKTEPAAAPTESILVAPTEPSSSSLRKNKKKKKKAKAKAAAAAAATAAAAASLAKVSAPLDYPVSCKTEEKGSTVRRIAETGESASPSNGLNNVQPRRAGGTRRRQRTQSEPSQHVSFNLAVNDVLLYTPNQSPQTKKKNNSPKGAKLAKHRPLIKMKRRFDGK